MVVCDQVPFNLGPDDIDDLVREAGNVLVAQVNGDARLLLQLAGRICGGGPVGDVLAGVLEGGLGEGHDLVVGDGRGRVVAHGERAGTRSARGEGGEAGGCIHAVRRDSDGEVR